MTKYLIINADDFGLSAGVNAGVAAAHEDGVVTSASLMVRGPSLKEAATYALAHPDLSIGLHVDLGEWTVQDGQWVPVYERVDTDDYDAVADEVAAQFALFKAVMGTQPSHVDSHQHVHRREPARSLLVRTAEGLGIPLRECANIVRYSGQFYGQTTDGGPLLERVSVDSLLGILENVADGVTELSCHPGDDDLRNTAYRSERRAEVTTLCDARVRKAIKAAGINLCSFASPIVQQLLGHGRRSPSRDAVQRKRPPCQQD